MTSSHCPWVARCGTLLGFLIFLAAPAVAATIEAATAETRHSAPTPTNTAEKPRTPANPDAASAPEVTPEDVPAAPIPPEKPENSSDTPAELPADLTPNQRQQLLIEGDRLWLQGRHEDAEFLYRKAKNPFQAVRVSDRPEPISDPALLPPAGQVYWREAEAGREMRLTTRTSVALALLTEQYPQFLPGIMRYAEFLVENDKAEEALSLLEQATTQYPEQADLVRSRVTTLAGQRQWLEASIAARQFAMLYADDPTASDFTALADQYLRRYRSAMRERLTGNAIANVITGVASYALTGGWLGPISAIQTSVLMLRGESKVGESAANDLSHRLELIEDESVVSYVNEIGQRIASVSGRSEFQYQFYVVRDPDLNAFALPGGKVFVNAGAILKTDSEAELAGLLAHELSHAVLSHGFQMVMESSVAANVLQFIPYGGIASNLLVLNYSRDMERQADALGTRILASSGYAADGLHNLMVTLGQQEEDSPFKWLSTHPDTDERIHNIELQIERNGYNRYAFEGVEHHLEMQRRVQALMPEEPEEKKPDTAHPD